MLRMILVSLFIFLPTFSQAKVVTIDSQIFYGGRKMGSPRISNSTGKTSKIVLVDPKTNKKFNVEIKTKEISKNLYDVNYSLILKEKDNETFNRGSVRVAKNESAKIHIDQSNIVMNLEVD